MNLGARRMSGMLEDYQNEINKLKADLYHGTRSQGAPPPTTYPFAKPLPPPPPPPTATGGGTPPTYTDRISVKSEGELPPRPATMSPFKPGGGEPGVVSGGRPGNEIPVSWNPPPPGPPPRGPSVPTASPSSMREIGCYICGAYHEPQRMSRFDAAEAGCLEVMPDRCAPPQPPSPGPLVAANPNVPTIAPPVSGATYVNPNPPPQRPSIPSIPGGLFSGPGGVSAPGLQGIRLAPAYRYEGAPFLSRSIRIAGRVW
jgi:hypothetical protein